MPTWLGIASQFEAANRRTAGKEQRRHHPKNETKAPRSSFAGLNIAPDLLSSGCIDEATLHSSGDIRFHAYRIRNHPDSPSHSNSECHAFQRLVSSAQITDVASLFLIFVVFMTQALKSINVALHNCIAAMRHCRFKNKSTLPIFASYKKNEKNEPKTKREVP